MNNLSGIHRFSSNVANCASGGFDTVHGQGTNLADAVNNRRTGTLGVIDQ
jgi:hypothetical protein